MTNAQPIDPGVERASSSPRRALSPLDARILRATNPMRERTAARLARTVGCSEDVAHSCLRRLRGRMLVEPDGCRPTGWLRTRDGDLTLEHQP